MDYGNKDKVHYSALYKIPNQFLVYKTFANSFRLSQVGKSRLQPGQILNNLFEKITQDLPLKLTVVPMEGIPVSQYCELVDENNANIMDTLKKAMPSNGFQAPLKQNQKPAPEATKAVVSQRATSSNVQQPSLVRILKHYS